MKGPPNHPGSETTSKELNKGNAPLSRPPLFSSKRTQHLWPPIYTHTHDPPQTREKHLAKTSPSLSLSLSLASVGAAPLATGDLEDGGLRRRGEGALGHREGRRVLRARARGMWSLGKTGKAGPRGHGATARRGGGESLRSCRFRSRLAWSRKEEGCR